MLDVIKPLIDSGIVNEETRAAIQESWDSKLTEAREQVRTELREEFARRYDHDKTVMVEALDKLVNETLKQELAEFAIDKKAIAEDRVKFKKYVAETGTKFNTFLTSKLAEEIKELRTDRKVQLEAIAKLEKFVIRALAEEIKEFEKDKKAVVETKVRLISVAKEKLAELKTTFIKRSSVLVKEAVTKNLDAELKQFKTDVRAARENMFGRRIYEAFASEFSATHLNENKEVRKLTNTIAEQAKIIESTKKQVLAKSKLAESKEVELNNVKNRIQRKDTINELLETLNKDKQKLMSELLENVQTDKLKSAFDKYLPAVLTNGKQAQPTEKKVVLAESRKEVTGDKSVKQPEVSTAGETNVYDLKRLAGLK